jgi:tungstate transport system ATP-binding protein
VAAVSTSWVYQLEGVRKEYLGRTVLNVKELNINRGEMFAIVGPSGAGKSTLLRILDFLEAPNNGFLRYDGGSISMPVSIAVQRDIGMLFQRPELLAATVRENVSFPLKLRGKVDDMRVEEVLDQMGLTSLATSDTRNLSGGELQRVALARVLVARPKVLLLDEPTANLDPFHVELIEKTTRDLLDDVMTIVIVTHNVFQARRLADRTGLMLNGEFIEIAETEKFFENPDDERVIDFIGGKMVY